MIRRAFTMRLKPGGLDEYRTHHDRIWPELVAEIERQGIGQITTGGEVPISRENPGGGYSLAVLRTALS